MNALRTNLTSLAARLSSSSREAQNVVQVPVEAISPNPHQPRKFFDPKRLEEIAASIKAKGVQQPIALTELEPGKYELIFGERRWRATKAAGLTHIPAILKEKLSETDKLIFALVENLDREDMTPFDEAVGVAKLVELTSVHDASAALQKPKAWISKRVAIANAPEFVAEFSSSGVVGDTEALYELSKLAVDQPQQAKQFIREYEPGSHLREQLKAAQRPPAPDTDGGENTPAAAARGGRHADSDERVSHAKRRSGDGSKPMKIEAILRRAGEVFLVTSDGQIRVKFSPKARQQLAKYLEEA